MSEAPPVGHEIRVFEDNTSLLDGATKAVIGELEAAGSYPRLVLAGGSTPVGLYERLVRSSGDTIVWSRVRFTFGDERSVLPEHESSNFGMARRMLLDPLGIQPERVLRLHGENPAEKAAQKAHRALIEWAQRVPLFDVVLLGMGQDGHVASLFPSEEWPDLGARLAVATKYPGGDDRVSLTPQALRSTRITVFLVSGSDKARAVVSALTADGVSARVPSRMVVSESSRALWLLDAASASQLPETWRS
jgi:6-phosphogluconolactonase